MKIIISHAKKMNVNTGEPYFGMPVFLDDTKEILRWLRTMAYPDLKKLWACNDKIACLNYDRLTNMDLDKSLTPAILSYEGIQYQYMAPSVFEYGQFDYVRRTVLRDGVCFYQKLKEHARKSRITKNIFKLC